MVEIEVNGLLEVLRCRIDPQLFAQGDRELIEDLVVAAVNQAIAKGKQLHADGAESDLTGGLHTARPCNDDACKSSPARRRESEERAGAEKGTSPCPN